jgi:hypothetical protein
MGGLADATFLTDTGGFQSTGRTALRINSIAHTACKAARRLAHRGEPHESVQRMRAARAR